MHREQVSEAIPGYNVNFKVKSLCVTDIKRGFVASNAKKVSVTDKEFFKAQVIVMNHHGLFINDFNPVLDSHTSHITCKFAEI